MNIQITADFIEVLLEKLESADFANLQTELQQLHPADIAEILTHLPEKHKKTLLNFLSEELRADVIAELDEDEREILLEKFTPQEIAEQVVGNMESDDAADLISELSDDKKEQVIQAIEDLDQANDIINLLSYPEDSAGGLMAKELVKVNINWTIHECIIELRKQAEEVEQVHTVYAVDNQDKLIGRISLKQLILTSPQTIADEIVNKEIVTVKANAETSEVAKKMEKYDLVVIPVIDEEGRLLGRITIDDVVDLIKDEAEKDYQMASGISENVEYSDGVLKLTKARFPWLLVGLIGGVTGAKIVGLFGVIEQNPTLAYFMPLIAAMGGNVGVQSSAIVVQSIANNSFNESIISKLSKELGVGLLNGLMCSLILLAFNLFFNQDLNISYAVSASLFMVITLAAVFGAWVPLLLHRFKIDPALATGPFITTSNDIIGLFLYFSICQYFL